jgi:hypothetical protein
MMTSNGASLAASASRVFLENYCAEASISGNANIGLAGQSWWRIGFIYWLIGAW